MAQDQVKTVSVEICDASPSATVFGNAGEFMGIVVNLINNAVAEFPRGNCTNISHILGKRENVNSEDVIRLRLKRRPPVPGPHPDSSVQ